MTTRRHLDLLSAAFIVRQLPPWFENLGKRQVKAPKIYIRDSGLLHALLGIRSPSELEGHPKLGASWEGFVLGLLLRYVRERDAYYWAIHSGPELDLLIVQGSRRIGFEVKWADAPRLTLSMEVASRDLRLNSLYVIYPGESAYRLADHVEVIPVSQLDRIVKRHKLKA